MSGDAAFDGQKRQAILAAIVDRFESAQAAAGAHEVTLRVAGEAVRLRFAGRVMRDALVPAVAHLEDGFTGGVDAPGLVLHVWDTASTGVGMIPALWDLSVLGFRGEIPEAVAQGFYAIYRLGNAQLLLLDAAAGVGVMWMRDAADLYRWERAAPFRTLLAAYFEPRGKVVTHAAAIGVGGRGVLLGGRGGSGKSSTSLVCLEAGMRFAGDDYVLSEIGHGAPRVHSLYATGKVLPHDVARFTDVARTFDGEAGSGEDEKAIAFLFPRLRERLASGFELVALLMPSVTGRPDTRVVPMSRAQALRGLAPSTVFQHDGERGATLARLAKLTASLPCWRLELGTERARIPDVIADLIARDGAPSSPAGSP